VVGKTAAASGADWKPQRRSEFVESVWWTCRVGAHRHRTREAALRCARRFRGLPGRAEWLARAVLGVEALIAGGSGREIATAMGVSASAVPLILARALTLAGRETSRPAKVSALRQESASNLARWLSWLQEEAALAAAAAAPGGLAPQEKP